MCKIVYLVHVLLSIIIVIIFFAAPFRVDTIVQRAMHCVCECLYKQTKLLLCLLIGCTSTYVHKFCRRSRPYPTRAHLPFVVVSRSVTISVCLGGTPDSLFIALDAGDDHRHIHRSSIKVAQAHKTKQI